MGAGSTALGDLRPKLVVWDIDGTLWDGLLDADRDGAVRHGVALIPQLDARGVLNTICSNNSPDIAREALDRWGLSEHTIFEQVSWDDKSSMLARILEFFAISPRHTVVVDDDPRVRSRLVSDHDVIAVSPEELDGADLSGWGDNSTGTRRTLHYRVLEQRHDAEDNYRTCTGEAGSSVGFLQTCRIELTTVDVRSNAARISELSFRSNRLNLTGSRLTPETVRELAEQPRYICTALAVRDKFGDYGLCGFAAFDSSQNSVSHFFWSCRVLNQGIVEHVVQAICDRFGYRMTHSALVDFGSRVDWVGGDQPFMPLQGVPTSTRNAADVNPIRVGLIGGCDMDIVAGIWDVPGAGVEVHGLTEHHGVQQYAHSSLPLLIARTRCNDSDFDFENSLPPWTGRVQDPRSWNVYDLVVLSLWVDYSSLTISRSDPSPSLSIPTYADLGPESSEHDWTHWVGDQLSREEYFREYKNGPPLTPDEIAGYVVDLGTVLPKDVHLALLGAPEVDRGISYSWGEDQCIRNRAINDAVRAAVSILGNVSFVDISAWVTSSDHFVTKDEPTGFHYRRDVYARLAECIEVLLSARAAR